MNRASLRAAFFAALSILVAGGLVIGLLPNYWVYLITAVFILGIALQSLGIVTGRTGMISLCQMSFAGVGAWTVGYLNFIDFPGGLPLWLLLGGLAALPFGIIIGLPALRLRGINLAIVTLGFAEIIRILVLSNFLQPLLGGAQGILNIPKPELFLGTLAAIIPTLPGYVQTVAYMFASEEGLIKDPPHFFYLILIGCVIVAFIARRLQNARVGRNWMAMREDEDVAEAVGINLIFSKLLAFGIGAAFAGLSGAIFAAQVGSVFPHSFGLIVSIIVVSLVIIGGSGSIPGVIVGSLVLVGMPELLREFSEFRLLIYGALLVVMMLVKPEGLWPSEVRKREFHVDDDEPVDIDSTPAAQAA